MTRSVLLDGTPAPSDPPAGRRRSDVVAAVVAVAVPTVVVAVHMLAYGRWIVDDAAITFSYARSIAAGAGPVLQPGGELAEGYSNPAWLAILLLGHGIGLFDHGSWFGVPDLVLFPKAVALLCCAGIFAGFHTVARAVWPRPSRWPAIVTVVAGTATAVVPSFVIWVSSGLENPLLALAAVTTAAVLARARSGGDLLRVSVAVTCGLLAAVAALTRPDGLVYLGAYPIAVLLTLRRDRLGAALISTVASVVAFAIPFGGYLTWRVLTFGRWLPNTAVAKSQGLPDTASLARPAELLSYPGWLSALLVLGLVAVGLFRPGRHRGVLVAVLVPLMLAVAAFGVLSEDWMGVYRFATPVWPLAALAATVAAAAVLPKVPVRGRALVALLAVAGALLSGITWLDGARTFRATPTISMCAGAQGMGASPNAFGDILGIPSGAIATPDIGGTALASRYQVIDIAGLASARIADLWRAGDMAGIRDHLLVEARPAFIEIHGGWSTSTGLLDDPRMDAEYVPIMKTAARSGWYVRRDLVPDQARFAAAVRHAEQVALPQRVRYSYAAPRSSCGGLEPGTTPVVEDPAR
ncbi:hypothetical protein [Pseudonocardia sp. KRD291]|uniref:hypothetical protein n=1 Tax=Pseudonocardia sp. KRD291 TaxID=2792007 RepID=UPI001C4A68B5|nr:hypothetical protein [Pseudonocardia sp. KRD291]MBW0104473.1 hypothetical protein [Pseudonocardia sp. KRD291]